MSTNVLAFEPPQHPLLEATSPTPSLAITMSQIKPRPLEWLWPGWLALGKLAVVDADPEQGKAFVLLDLAARLSRGAPMPHQRDDKVAGTLRVPELRHTECADYESPNRRNGETANSGGHPRPPMDVTMLIAEDSLEDTVFPRLEAAGADLSRIHILKSIPRFKTSEVSKTSEVFKPGPQASPQSPIRRFAHSPFRNSRPPRLPKDLHVVEEIIEKTNSRLLIIEPGLADLDRHCLCLLADLADRLRCTVVLQRYLNKWSAATRAICRGGGSMSVIGAARTAMLIARDPREEAIRILASTKNNFGPRPASLRFVLEPHASPGGWGGGGTCRVHWLGPSPLLADDLLGMEAAVESKTAIAEAIKFLKEFLKDGPKSKELCYAEAKNQQIAERTLRRAKLRLGVVCNKPRTLLGLYLPSTWELQGQSECHPPVSLANGPLDDGDRRKCLDLRDFRDSDPVANPLANGPLDEEESVAVESPTASESSPSEID